MSTSPTSPIFSPSTCLRATAHLLRAADAARWASISKSTWYAWVAAGRLPPGIKLSPGVTVWDMDAVANALTYVEVA